MQRSRRHHLLRSLMPLCSSGSAPASRITTGCDDSSWSESDPAASTRNRVIAPARRRGPHRTRSAARNRRGRRGGALRHHRHRGGAPEEASSPGCSPISENASCSSSVPASIEATKPRNGHLRGKRAAICAPTTGPENPGDEPRVQVDISGRESTLYADDLGWGLNAMTVGGPNSGRARPGDSCLRTSAWRVSTACPKGRRLSTGQSTTTTWSLGMS